MFDETNTQEPETRTYSPAELKLMRSQMIEDYKQENILLRLRSEHTTLTAEIEVQETRRLNAILQRYDITRAAKDAQGFEVPKPEVPKPEVPKQETPTNEA